MRQVAQIIGSLVQLDSAAEVLAGSLVALPEGCSSDAVRAEPAVADAVKAPARVVRAFRLPLGEALPGLRLAAGQLISPQELTPRIRNALFRADIRTWGDLARRSELDLLDIRAFGQVSVEVITEAAVWRVVLTAAGSAAGGPQLPPRSAGECGGGGASARAAAAFGVEVPTVPTGAILTAVTMVEALGDPDDEQMFARVAAEVPLLVARWGIPVLTQAFGLLIGAAVTLVTPPLGGPGRLHLVLPPVLTRLNRLHLPGYLLPAMAGVLPAACLDQDPWQWRHSIGPIGNAEALAWCYTAWLVTDFVDTVVLREHGAFTRRLTGLVTCADAIPDDLGGLDNMPG